MTATTVLNVDDVEMARYTKTRVLQHAGYRVVEAENGEQALRQMETHKPTLVVLDVRLPDLSGIEVCRIVKQRWPTTVVLQTSATFVSSTDRTRALEGGADSLLIQPIDPDELVATVRTLMRMHDAEEAMRALNSSLERRVQERTAELHAANEALLAQIARRERVESELVQAQKMEAVGQLTGSLAHDFNNILASMTGYIQLIRRKAAGGPIAEMSDKALAAADRGKRLTTRLMTFSRIATTAPIPTDIGTSIVGMRDLLAQSLGSSSTLQIKMADTMAVSLVDANAFELALLNLVINARDAMPGGGAVTIVVERRTLSQADRELKAGDYVTVTVGDTGVGMDAEVAARAFDPFFTTKLAGQGTGLGLAQVLKLGQAAGGSARIDSQPGNGTRVVLWMAESNDAPSPETVIAQRIDAGRRELVLVVDDESDIRETLSLLLVEQGYRVETAASGAEALARLQDEVPKLALLDLSMPDMNGLELAKRLRARHPLMPMLFISGHAHREQLRAEIPGVDLVRKPFDADQLYAEVRRAVDAWR